MGRRLRKTMGLATLLIAIAASVLLFTALKTDVSVEMGPTTFDVADEPSESPYKECLTRYTTTLSELEHLCPAFLSGDKEAERKLKSWTPASRLPKLNRPLDCKAWEERLCLPWAPASPEEAAFPLAFVILLDSDVEQTLRLLQLLYQPQNVYCFSYDRHNEKSLRSLFSTEKTEKVLRSLSRCSPNILVPAKQEYVAWGDFGILAAARNCLEAVAESGLPWKYAQVMSWSDAPLRTNLETVRILRLLRGGNDVQLQAGKPSRYTHPCKYLGPGEKPPTGNFSVLNTDADKGRFLFDLTRLKGPPPGRLRMYKGSFAATLSRSFVEYMLRDKVARLLYAWLRDTFIPDETYWASLVHNEGAAPGGFSGQCEAEFRRQGGFKLWMTQEHEWNYKYCKGKMVHGSCLYGLSDLPRLLTSPRIVAHKFYPSFQPAAWHCLALMHRQRTVKPERGFQLHLYSQRMPAALYARDSNLSCSKVAMTSPTNQTKTLISCSRL